MVKLLDYNYIVVFVRNNIVWNDSNSARSIKFMNFENYFNI